MFYDNNGNLVDDGTNLYAYDFKNRLVEVRLKVDDSLIARYSYDCMNRRVLKTLNQPATEKTQYLYEGWNVIEERDQLDNLDLVSKQYVLRSGLDRPVQYGVFTSQQQQPTQVYYYHCNSQGSVGALTDQNENIVEYYEYDSYGTPHFFDAGQIEIAGSLVGNVYLFQARRLDNETQNYYYRNRYYNPDQGRFIHRDPLGMWHDVYNFGNGYTLTGNRAWDLSDPMGLGPEPDNRPDYDPFHTMWDPINDTYVNRGEDRFHDLTEPTLPFYTSPYVAPEDENDAEAFVDLAFIFCEPCKETCLNCCDRALATTLTIINSNYALQMANCVKLVKPHLIISCITLRTTQHAATTQNVAEAHERCKSKCKREAPSTEE